MTKTIARYEVCGKRAYRGHLPGTEFEALLDRNAEIRAVNRGSIRVLDRMEADLPPGMFRLPSGWPAPEEQGRKG